MAILVAFGSTWAYSKFSKRSIVVEADTGALTITLSGALEAKTFQGARECTRRDTRSTTPGQLGCPSTHRLSPPEPNYTTGLPAGTTLRFTTEPGRMFIRVQAMAERYRDTEVGKLIGGGILLEETALRQFGSISMRGIATIGAVPAETEQASVISGNYQIFGLTIPTGFVDPNLRVLREGSFQSGVLATFDEGGEPSDSRISMVVPDVSNSFMRVTAFSTTAPVDLRLSHFFAEPVLIRPTILDALLNDPTLILFGTILGGTALFGLFIRRERRAVAQITAEREEKSHDAMPSEKQAPAPDIEDTRTAPPES